MKHIALFITILLFANCTNSTQTKETEIVVTTPIQTGHYTEAYPSGQLKIKGDLAQGIRQGKWISYYEDGKIWSETNYLEGEKNGQTKSFFSNGNLRFLGHYLNDKKTDQWFFYNENGQFEKEIDFTIK